MDQEHTISVSRRTVRLALAFAVVMAVLAPAAVFAVGGTFVDDDTSIFEEDIEWLVANGVTSGCGTDTYCPEDNVTRGQMAAFMRRLATKQVVDAATAVTATSADSATTADSATSADTAAEADTAQNSRLLDGFDSTEYALGLVGFDEDPGGTVLAVGESDIVASVDLDIPRRCSLLNTEAVEVLVIGSGYVDGSGAVVGRANATLTVDGGSPSSSNVSANVDGSDTRTPYSTQWLFEVTPGAHTFDLTVTSSAGTVIEWYSKLSAQVLGSTCDSIIMLPGEPASADGLPGSN